MAVIINSTWYYNTDELMESQLKITVKFVCTFDMRALA